MIPKRVFASEMGLVYLDNLDSDNNGKRGKNMKTDLGKYNKLILEERELCKLPPDSSAYFWINSASCESESDLDKKIFKEQQRFPSCRVEPAIIKFVEEDTMGGDRCYILFVLNKNE